MQSDHIYPDMGHIEWPSLFSNMQIPNDRSFLEAIKFWELAADAKYIDIKGYFCCILATSIDCRDCAKKELSNVHKLLETGVCNLLSGYDEFDIEQIKPCYDCFITGRWKNFISKDEYQNYIEAQARWQKNYDDMIADGVEDERFFGMPEMNLEGYFSRRWIVSTQVQALVWYMKFLHDIVENGISFREDQRSIIKDKEQYVKRPSCGRKSIHKVIDNAFYKVFEQNKELSSSEVLDEIYNEFIYAKTSPINKERSLDKHSIIVSCEARLISGKKVIKWKTNDNKEASLTSKRFSELVKKLIDENPI